jgi:hypothetical protein
MKDFRDSQPRAGRGLGWQGIGGEKTAIDDLPIWFGLAILPEVPDDIDGNVIAPRNMAVEKNAVQRGFAAYLDSPFLHEFAIQRRTQGLTDLDAAARQMPACHIAMLDQKDPVVGVEHHAAHAERQAASEPAVQVKQPAQHGLATAPQTVEIHDA